MPTQDKAALPGWLITLFKRATVLIVAGFAISWVLNRAERALEHRHELAGFAHGVLQGALMPIALPNLVLGKDVTIYAEHNTGRPYKIGYTMGVNGCGLVFFGFFFWRVRKLRQRIL